MAPPHLHPFLDHFLLSGSQRTQCSSWFRVRLTGLNFRVTIWIPEPLTCRTLARLSRVAFSFSISSGMYCPSVRYPVTLIFCPGTFTSVVKILQFIEQTLKWMFCVVMPGMSDISLLLMFVFPSSPLTLSRYSAAKLLFQEPFSVSFSMLLADARKS